ncbi:MAG TPA: ribonuclease catalytic domain-containing protein [Paenalcaligenes sp.]|nr:ribonuclease catalytic domain-containing protein [Paenalcaligenes sp.]
MYVLYEDNSRFKAEKVFSRAERSLQVESATGKRSKIRTDRVFMEFDKLEPNQLLEQAEQLAKDIDIDFVWECAPQEVFEATEFAADYYGTPRPDAIQQAALIFALHSAPAYFHRRGTGKYRPAPPETLRAALAAIERRRLEEERQNALTQAMLQGELPDEIAAQAEDLLLAPDKNSTEWKAFQAVLDAKKCSPEALLLELNAWSSPLALHRHQFFAEHFPKGLNFDGTVTDLALDLQDYPEAAVEAYSIDDAGTTEIDDAFSVVKLDENNLRMGIHIAVPALGIERQSHWDEQARQRMATVYTPGQKIPMLPDALIEQFSLLEKQVRPTLSLYVDLDLDSGEILAHDTRIERISVTQNLFHDDLKGQIDQAALEDPQQTIPYGDFLRPLWSATQVLRKQREEARGWPENNNRAEFLFELEGPADNPDSIVHLIARDRQAPLGTITAELMILTNKLWAGLLQQHGLPAAFRSQQNMRTRMSTHALPHRSIGVPYYMWATSPLRRYIDLANQRQIIAAAEHGVSARLVAPYQPKDPDLYALISTFEEQYGAWNAFQHKIERYWALRWIQQQQKSRLHAQVIRNDLVRFSEVPLVTPVPGLPDLERDQEVWVEVVEINEVDLSLGCRLIEVCTPDDACTE